MELEDEGAWCALVTGQSLDRGHHHAAAPGRRSQSACRWIELYQLNAVDPKVPLDESLGALVQLQREGKIRAIGLCNVSVDELERARAVTRITSVQGRLTRSGSRFAPATSEVLAA